MKREWFIECISEGFFESHEHHLQKMIKRMNELEALGFKVASASGYHITYFKEN